MDTERRLQPHKGDQIRVHHEVDGKVLPQETMRILGKKVDPEGHVSYLAAYPGIKHVQDIPMEAFKVGMYGCIVIDELIPTGGFQKR